MFLKLFLGFVFLSYLTLLSLILGRHLFPPARGMPLPRKDTAFDEPTELILELENVDKSFDYPVLKGVSFKMRRGETLGVLGKSGSGKSVTLKLIAGLLKPDVGPYSLSRKRYHRHEREGTPGIAQAGFLCFPRRSCF